MTPEDKRHGTNAGYRAGCRQQCCRDAASRYERARRLDHLSGRPRTHSPVGVQRRLQALARLGWPMNEIAARSGVKERAMRYTVAHRRPRYTSTVVAERIAAIYEELSMTLGPSPISRSRAEKKGWPPPLAWDEDTIDDPNASPIVAREPGRQGIAAGQIGSTELVEEWLFLRSLGESMHSAARQLGVSVAAIEKAVERVGKRAA